MAPAPALVLLDLNLPGTDGVEVLATIKADAGLRCLPVVVVSASSDPAEIRRCYEANVAGFVVKPMRFEDLVDAVAAIAGYWLRVVALPPWSGAAV